MVSDDLAQLSAATHWHDPIIIVGANPVGLITALGLAYYRIPSVVVDEGSGTSLESNQLALLDQSTLAILDTWSQSGQQIVANGVIPTGERVLFRKSQLYRAPLAVYEPGMPYPRLLNIHQATLEHLLLQILQRVGGCQVLWQHSVRDMVQDHEGVDIELATPGGNKYLRVPYLLVTNGPPTPMHDALGINHTGTTPDQRFLSLDILTKLENPHERWYWFDAPFNPGYITQLHPLPDGIVRVVYQLRPGEDPAAIGRPEALQQRIVNMLGQRSYEVIALNTHSYQRRAIEQFKHGRLLFLGSAAHSLSLFGASEANSGAQDAWNLVWKLALVRAGLAMEESLLDTYHIERHAAAVAYLESTNETMSFLTPPRGLAEWKRNTTLKLSQPFKVMRNSIQLGDSSGSYTYKNSPIFSDDHRLYLGGRFTELSGEQSATLKRFRLGPQVGTLAPLLTLPDADTGTPVSLLARSAQGFVALCFTADVEMALAVLQQVPMQISGVPISFLVITPLMPAVPAEGGITIVLDADHKAANAYNTGPRSLYLIRPDRVIAARRFDSDFNDIPALLRHAVGEDVVDTQSRIRRPETKLSASQ